MGPTIFAKKIWTDRAKVNFSPLVNVVKYLQPPRDGQKHSKGNSFLLSTTLRGGGGNILVITGSSFSPSKHGYRFKVFGKDCSFVP